MRWISLLLLCACTSDNGIREVPGPGGAPPDPQAIEPEFHVDVVLQVFEPAADVLWVLDSSGSMEDDRSALAAAFPGFVAPFVDSAVDFHIGVITMDMGRESHQGKLREADGQRWLDPTTKHLPETFADMATAAIDTGKKKASLPFDDENGRDATFFALEVESRPGGYNHGFLRERDSAWLHITVMSDENDESTMVSLDDFVAFLRSLRSLPDRVSFNSIVALTTTGLEVRGEDYLAVTDAIGGRAASLNGEDWPNLLAQLGALQAPAPATEFYLSRLPVVSTVEVRSVTQDGVTLVHRLDDEYVYDESRNSVVFDDLEVAPPTGARVEIRYRLRRL